MVEPKCPEYQTTSPRQAVMQTGLLESKNQAQGPNTVGSTRLKYDDTVGRSLILLLLVSR